MSGGSYQMNTAMKEHKGKFELPSFLAVNPCIGYFQQVVALRKLAPWCSG